MYPKNIFLIAFKFTFWACNVKFKMVELHFIYIHQMVPKVIILLLFSFPQKIWVSIQVLDSLKRCKKRKQT